MNLENKIILVTGGAGFLGSFVVVQLQEQGAEVFVPRSSVFDLADKKDCDLVFQSEYDIVIHMAGRVGGIGLNKEKPYTLWSENLRMGLNILDAAIERRIQKVVVVGTVCEYPKVTPVPFLEENLHNGYPEETNAPYGYAKRAMLVGGNAARAQFGANIIHLLPVNLYGPGDHFEPEKSHVIPALIKKVADAQKAGLNFVEIWGSGKASREFLYIEDAAKAIVLATQHYDKPEPVNIGAGFEITIKELVEKICHLMDFGGEIRWDASKPDGQPRRCLDVSRAEKEFGFRAKTNFDEGLEKTISWYLKTL